jgi:flagellar motor switch protein FliN/FliY
MMDEPQTVVDALGGLDAGAIYGVRVNVAVVLGKASLRVHQLLKLGRGAVVQLDRRTNEPVEVYANDRLIAYGEVIITDGDKIGVTLTEVIKNA